MGSTDSSIPYGHRLIANIIDERARDSPSNIYCSLQRSGDPKDEAQDVTYAQLANAINQAAWWIEKTLGKSTNFETLPYIGPSDLRYAILTIAGQKTGYNVSRNCTDVCCHDCLTSISADFLPVST